jgi:hypothetical protein
MNLMIPGMGRKVIKKTIRIILPPIPMAMAFRIFFNGKPPRFSVVLLNVMAEFMA